MKRLLTFLMCLVVTISIVGCDKTDTADTGENEKSKGVFSVAMVADKGSVKDKSFYEGIWEGLEAFSKETNSVCKYAKSDSDTDYVQDLAQFVQEDYDLIIAPAHPFKDAMTEVADDYPDSKFLIIDDVLDKPNVASAVFAENEGSYLVGIAAAKKAIQDGRNKVGFIGGVDIEVIQRFEAGFEAGVKSVDPNMEVVAKYVDSFKDENKARIIANDMFDEGVDVIFHASGDAGNGLIDEAKSRCEDGDMVWVIGVDKDQYDDGIYAEGKSCVLTSMMKKAGVASYSICMETMKGEFPGGQTIVFDIKNGGVDIPEKNPNLDEDTIETIEKAKEDVKDGKIQISKVPSRLADK